jgi:DNA-directed RNA polymerase subunit RPC12/RpoP
MFSMLLLKNDRAVDPTPLEAIEPHDDEAPRGIRCPLCSWRPSPSCRWACFWIDTPEPFFASCGASWNTFTTRGRCPGCGHQWKWTSCLSCGEWSLHEDWYEVRAE